jgi:uncharacterized protein YjiS (DUF1127 family)
MTTNPAVLTGPVPGPAVANWTRLSRALAEYRSYRTTLAELHSLTEAQLSDLGMRPDALRAIAREAARKN